MVLIFRKHIVVSVVVFVHRSSSAYENYICVSNIIVLTKLKFTAYIVGIGDECMLDKFAEEVILKRENMTKKRR